MNRHSRPRLAAAILAMLGLLFAQLAVSAFACPGMQGVAPAAAMSEMPGCDMAPVERDRSPLCQAHCVQSDSSLQKTHAAPAGMAALCGNPIATPAWEPQSIAREAPDRQGSLLERPTRPPLAVLHCRFLI